MSRFLFAILLLLTPLFAQEPTEPQSGEEPSSSAQAVDPNEADHQALRVLKEQMANALNNRDLDELVKHVTDDVVFTTMNSDVCKGPEAIRAYFKKMLGDPTPIVKDVKVTFEADALTHFYSPTLGMAYGRSLDRYELANGFKFKIDGRWTCLMVKQNDEWKISAFHYSGNLFNNPILESYKVKIPAIAMGVAGIGLAVGGLLGWLIAKGRKQE